MNEFRLFMLIAWFLLFLYFSFRVMFAKDSDSVKLTLINAYFGIITYIAAHSIVLGS